VAKPKKLPLSTAASSQQQQLAEAEGPRIKWSVVAQIAVGVIVVWALAIGSIPYVGYWAVGIVAILTAVLIGFGVYAWRLMRHLKGEPGAVQDEVRANLAFLYLAQGRPKDARPLADELRLDRQQNPKAKAMYAAVMAETFARTGKADEAKKLLETYRADDPAYGEVSFVLLRAQIYTFFATKNRGLMRKAMLQIAERDPNQLAPFMTKGAHPEMQAAVREILTQAGFQTRAKQKIQRS